MQTFFPKKVKKAIDQKFDKARKLTRNEALKKVEKKKNDQNVLVVEYHPGLPSISSHLIHTLGGFDHKQKHEKMFSKEKHGSIQKAQKHQGTSN